MKTYNASEIKVLSGNSILLNGVPLLMFGMHAPGIKFKEGMAARTALAGVIEDHGTVQIKIIPDRRRDRTQDMCEVFTPGGINLNHWMVSNGFAKAYVG